MEIKIKKPFVKITTYLIVFYLSFVAQTLAQTSLSELSLTEAVAAQNSANTASIVNSKDLNNIAGSKSTNSPVTKSVVVGNSLINNAKTITSGNVQIPSDPSLNSAKSNNNTDSKTNSSNLTSKVVSPPVTGINDVLLPKQQNTFPSILFSDSAIRDIDLAVKSYETGEPLSLGNKDDNKDAKKVSENIRSFLHLGSMIYFAPNNWTIWLDTTKISYDTNKKDSELYVKRIDKNQVTILWTMTVSKWKILSGKTEEEAPKINSDHQVEIKFTLRPNQTYVLINNQIVEGKINNPDSFASRDQEDDNSKVSKDQNKANSGNILTPEMKAKLRANPDLLINNLGLIGNSTNGASLNNTNGQGDISSNVQSQLQDQSLPQAQAQTQGQTQSQTQSNSPLGAGTSSTNSPSQTNIDTIKSDLNKLGVNIPN